MGKNPKKGTFFAKKMKASKATPVTSSGNGRYTTSIYDLRISSFKAILRL